MADLFIQITVSTPYDTDEYPVEYRILDADRGVLYDWQESSLFDKPDPSEHPDIYVQVRQPIDDDIVCVSEEHVVLETQLTGGLLVIGATVIDHGQPQWLHTYEYFDRGTGLMNVAIHPTRELVAMCNQSGDYVQIYNFTTEAGEEPLFTLESGDDHDIFAVCFGQDHFYVLEREDQFVDEPTNVRCFSLEDYSEVWHTQMKEEFRHTRSGIDLSPDGNRLIFMGAISSEGYPYVALCIVEINAMTGEEGNSWVFDDREGGWIQFDLNGDIIAIHGTRLPDKSSWIRSIRKHDRSDPDNILWENDFGGELETTSVSNQTVNACVDLNNDIIFAIRDTETNEVVIKVDGVTGQKLWSVQTPSAAYRSNGVGVDEENNVYSLFWYEPGTRDYGFFGIWDPDGNELFWGEVEDEDGIAYNPKRNDYHVEVFPGRFQSPVYQNAIFIPPLDRPALFYSGAQAQWDAQVEAVAGQISLDPPHELDFGEVEDGDDVVKTVDITNTGGEPISGSVELTESAGGVFSIISGLGSFTLDGGESWQVVVRYTAQTGPSNGMLEISHDAGNMDDPIEYWLRGQGV